VHFHFVLGRQVLNDSGVALQPSQQEGARDAAQARCGLVVAIALDRNGDLAAERFERTKQPRVRELEDRPKLGQAILDRRAGEGKAVCSSQRPRGLPGPGGRLRDLLLKIRRELVPRQLFNAIQNETQEGKPLPHTTV
jgi:hypothetical protein